MVVADIAFILETVDGSARRPKLDRPDLPDAAVCLGAVLAANGTTRITHSAAQRRRELIVPAIFGGVMIGLAECST